MRRWLLVLVGLVLVAVAAAGAYVWLERREEGVPWTFAYASPNRIETLDPARASARDAIALANVYETLTRYVPDPEPRIEPVLATSWTATDNQRTWTFRLRQNVRFHDGALLDSRAVKASVERTRRGRGPGAGVWDPVDAITTPDAQTVVFRLDYSAPLDLIAAASTGAYISGSEPRGDGAALRATSPGTGPYSVATRSADLLTLTRFEGYWRGWPEGRPERIVVRTVRNADERERLVADGEAHFTYDVPLSNIPELKQSDDVDVFEGPAYQNVLVLLNTERAPTNDLQIREALAYSFPYDAFISDTLRGVAQRTSGPVPRGVFAHHGGVTRPEFDLDRARRLLETARAPDDLSLEFTYTEGNAIELHAGELWRRALADIGVDLRLRRLEPDARLRRARSNPRRAQHAYVLGWQPTYPSPYDWLFNLFHTQEPPAFNLAYYSNSRFDALIDEANLLISRDRARARRLFLEAQEALVGDTPALFLVDQLNVHLVDPSVDGYVDNPAYPHVVFAYDLER